MTKVTPPSNSPTMTHLCIQLEEYIFGAIELFCYQFAVDRYKES